MTTSIPTTTDTLELACREDGPMLRRWDSLYALDWCLSLLLLIGTLPVTLLGAVWVMIVSPGNPFYTQERVGYGLEPYTIFKIRTMRPSGSQARFCAVQDERIIQGGAFLRKTRIDELPQLLNVLLGTMALVGPRPEQVPFVARYLDTIPGYGKRFSVKPGITGLAQVHHGYVASENGTRQKLRYDVLYINRRGFRTWFHVVAQTVRVILTGHGAR